MLKRGMEIFKNTAVEFVAGVFYNNFQELEKLELEIDMEKLLDK